MLKQFLLAGVSPIATAGAVARIQKAAFEQEVKAFCDANPQRAKELSKQYARETGQKLEE